MQSQNCEVTGDVVAPFLRDPEVLMPSASKACLRLDALEFFVSYGSKLWLSILNWIRIRNRFISLTESNMLPFCDVTRYLWAPGFRSDTELNFRETSYGSKSQCAHLVLITLRLILPEGFVPQKSPKAALDSSWGSRRHGVVVWCMDSFLLG